MGFALGFVFAVGPGFGVGAGPDTSGTSLPGMANSCPGRIRSGSASSGLAATIAATVDP